MKTNTSISIPEILLLIALAISILLPRAIIPFGLLVSGGTYLFYLIVHSILTHVPPKSSFGPASAALFIFIFGGCLLFLPDQPIITLVISIVATVIIQMIWIVLRNRLIGR